MIQDEANKRWCPFASSRVLRTSPDQAVTYAVEEVATVTCIASDCMAWRWITENTPDGRGIQASKTEGYCGLAGKL